MISLKATFFALSLALLGSWRPGFGRGAAEDVRCRERRVLRGKVEQAVGLYDRARREASNAQCLLLDFGIAPTRRATNAARLTAFQDIRRRAPGSRPRSTMTRATPWRGWEGRGEGRAGDGARFLRRECGGLQARPCRRPAHDRGGDEHRDRPGLDETLRDAQAQASSGASRSAARAGSATGHARSGPEPSRLEPAAAQCAGRKSGRASRRPGAGQQRLPGGQTGRPRTKRQRQSCRRNATAGRRRRPREGIQRIKPQLVVGSRQLPFGRRRVPRSGDHDCRAGGPGGAVARTRRKRGAKRCRAEERVYRAELFFQVQVTGGTNVGEPISRPGRSRSLPCRSGGCGTGSQPQLKAFTWTMERSFLYRLTPQRMGTLVIRR